MAFSLASLGTPLCSTTGTGLVEMIEALSKRLPPRTPPPTYADFVIEAIATFEVLVEGRTNLRLSELIDNVSSNLGTEGDPRIEAAVRYLIRTEILQKRGPYIRPGLVTMSDFWNECDG